MGLFQAIKQANRDARTAASEQWNHPRWERALESTHPTRYIPYVPVEQEELAEIEQFGPMTDEYGNTWQRDLHYFGATPKPPWPTKA